MSRRRKSPSWASLSNDALLDVRIRDLGVRIDNSWISPSVQDLFADLERRQIPFRPHLWFSADWFSPAGVPGIAVPFYLGHERLMRLERSQMLEIEGGSREEALMILRHECGHALQHAYRLHRRVSWQKLFGKSSRRYPDHYRPNPASRRFVQHLRLYYAQSHPDEDFAETFAVWLTGRTSWRKRYAGWPALKKLEYVEALMEELSTKKPNVRSRKQIDPLRGINKTLREYYNEKRSKYLISYPDIYDQDLRQLFLDDPAGRRSELASKFLNRNRNEIRRLVARWTDEYQFTLDQVLKDMIGRCRELKLRAVGSERELRESFAVLLTVKTMDFHYHRRNRVAL